MAWPHTTTEAAQLWLATLDRAELRLLWLELRDLRDELLFTNPRPKRELGEARRMLELVGAELDGR